MQRAGGRVLTYWLLEELGSDRLGRVFAAEDARGGEAVIVRILRVRDVAPAERVQVVRERLRGRIRAAAAVTHPAFPPILDFGEENEDEIVVYRRVPGETLADRLLLEREWPALDGVRHAIEVSGAIAAAHERGVLHRRLGPANILIGRDQRARVLDLGIPRPAEVAFDLAGVSDGHDPDVPLRQDVHALARTIQVLVTGSDDPASVRKPSVRQGIGGRVMLAVAQVMRQPGADARMLHDALVKVARQTPAGVEEQVRPVRPAVPPTAMPAAPPRETPAGAARFGRAAGPPSAVGTGKPATPRPPATPPPPPALALPPDESEDPHETAAPVSLSAGLLVPPGRRGHWKKAGRRGTSWTDLRGMAPRVAASAAVGALLVLGVVALPSRDDDAAATVPVAAETAAAGVLTAVVEASPAGTRIVRADDGADLGRDRVELSVAAGDSIPLLFTRPGFAPQQRVFRGERLSVRLEASPDAGPSSS